MGDAFVNPFSLTAPSGADLANGIDGYILDGTKKALDERFEQEHYSLSTGTDDVDSATGQGRHKAGKVGAWGKGPSATMRATLGAGTGAFWEITDTDAGTGLPAGTMFRYAIGVGWTDAQFGSGIAYATTTEIASATPPADKAISAATLRQADMKYLTIIGGSGTLSLTQTGTGPYVYTIEDFVDLATEINTSDIRTIHLITDLDGAATFDTSLIVKYPDDTEQTVYFVEKTETGRRSIAVPINPGQDFFTFRHSGASANTSIVGVTQKSYEV
jgi:hypothetical protein